MDVDVWNRPSGDWNSRAVEGILEPTAVGLAEEFSKRRFRFGKYDSDDWHVIFVEPRWSSALLLGGCEGTMLGTTIR
jgi:hypothetical protein